MEDDIEFKMNEIKSKSRPTDSEIRKYVRYSMNVRKLDNDHIMDECQDWGLAKIESTIKDVERENQKPRPQRYYVSLKDPLEGGN